MRQKSGPIGYDKAMPSCDRTLSKLTDPRHTPVASADSEDFQCTRSLDEGNLDQSELFLHKLYAKQISKMII